MTPDTSLWNFIINAGLIVKLVLIILLLASLVSWTIIFQRIFLFKQLRQEGKKFEKLFWSGIDLNQLFKELVNKNNNLTGLANIFYAGFNEFKRLYQSSKDHVSNRVMEGTQRAMRIAHAREIDALEQHLAFLATVGSTSPYIGLFGTVWGIMTSFRALSDVQQATIAMVAPGISEALIATAIGLFAAIPAVIAYNRFSNKIERINNQYEMFQEEFTNILQREINYNESEN